MTWLQTIVLGLVQGLTEFLPISSSAHLILINRLLGFEDEGLVLDVATHAGTLLAVLWYFRADLVAMVRNAPVEAFGVSGHSMILWLAIATVPVAVIGGMFADVVEGPLRKTWIIATATIVFALVLWWSYRLANRGQALNLKIALTIGLAQVLALIPGTSRSGITMSAGMMTGLSAQGAARFSFLMSIPAIGAAASFGILHLLQSPPGVIEIDKVLVAGSIAGVTAAATIHAFLRLIDRIGMLVFVVYRLLVGVALLLLA